jgi:hypothetical protein
VEYNSNFRGYIIFLDKKYFEILVYFLEIPRDPSGFLRGKTKDTDYIGFQISEVLFEYMYMNNCS